LLGSNNIAYSLFVKIADAANNQLADIETVLLQTRETHKAQIRGDIYSISEDLRNIIHGDMEQQAYHIQVLLADELDQYKDKEDERVKEYIKMIWKYTRKHIKVHYNQ